MSHLPVIQPSNRIRTSRTTRKRAAVLILVHLAVAVHIAHWLLSGRTMTPVEPSEAAALAVSGVINAGLIFFALIILSTAIFGRFFCGWACHLVALQDLSRALLERFGHRPKPLRSRLLAWVPLVACVYAFFWPVLYRWWLGRSQPVIETEFTTSQFWATFPGWVVGALTFFICGFAAVYFLGAKGFCTYACPYGALFAGADKLAPMRIRVTDACAGCGHCTAVCTSNVRVHEEVRDFGMVVDSGCMKCLDCVSVCPNDALYYGVGRLPMMTKARASGRKMRRFALTWAEELVAAAGFVGGFLAFRGLYGQVPFLMALGVAGVLAYLTLLGFQLLSRHNLALKGWQLKRAGEVQAAGTVFLAGFGLLLALWLHSGVVRCLGYRGDVGYRLARARAPIVLDLVASKPKLTGSQRRVLVRSLASFDRQQRLGLITSSGAAAKMAWIESLLGRQSALLAHASRAIDRGELAGEMHQLLGREAFEQQQLISAVGHFERAVVADPDDARGWTSLGVVRAQNGELEEARQVFERARVRFGDSSRLAYNLGLVAAYGGQIGEAAEDFARALELEPTSLPARENLAGMLATLGRFEESAGHYRRAIEQQPADPETRVLLARVLLAAGLGLEALEQVRVALDLVPEMPEALALERSLRSMPPPAGSTGG